MSISIEQFNPVILNTGFASHNADWNWKNVKSPFMRIYYVTEGSANIILPSGCITLKPGNLYLIPAFTGHSYSCDSIFCHFYIHIYENNITGTSIFENLELPLSVKGTEYDFLLMQELCEIIPQMDLPESDPKSYDNAPTLKENLIRNEKMTLCTKIESRGIIYLLLSRFLKQAKETDCKNKDCRIKDSVMYIHSHIYDYIDIGNLSEKACLSKDHFIRLFKHETGFTPLQYIIHKKIEKAQLMLVTEKLSVKNIAYRLSFEDYSYFTRVFRRVVGIPPKEYRETVK